MNKLTTAELAVISARRLAFLISRGAPAIVLRLEEALLRRRIKAITEAEEPAPQAV
jgi:hypothetical protein